MFSFTRGTKKENKIRIFNTLGRIKQEFVPVKGRYVGMYTCGPTVYNVAHIGNLRSYVTADILRRTLEYDGFEVRHIINITDVGHLVGDGDDGEDKMTAGLKREGLDLTLSNMRLLGEKYARIFIEDLQQLNVELPFAFPRASEHIPEQIAFVETLLDKGYAYKAREGIYFDTRKFPSYGALGMSVSTEHSRIGIAADKHDPKDFLLWRFDALTGWDTPWGKGFPGWHIECTAMSTKFLGKTFDLHTGGVDHIQIHHNNEIAQTEAATGKPFVSYWVHTEFLTIDQQKISKSIGNTISLSQLKDRGIAPLAYRYWLLTSHYRSPVNFTWDAVRGAQTALKRLLRTFNDLENASTKKTSLIDSAYREKFKHLLFDDFNTAEAIALVWELLRDSSVPPQNKRATLIDFDRILAIGLSVDHDDFIHGKISVVSQDMLPKEIVDLIDRREKARARGDFAQADTLRDDILKAGYLLEDTKNGPVARIHDDNEV